MTTDDEDDEDDDNNNNNNKTKKTHTTGSPSHFSDYDSFLISHQKIGPAKNPPSLKPIFSKRAKNLERHERHLFETFLFDSGGGDKPSFSLFGLSWFFFGWHL
jgi:hypothetical protein